MAGDLVGAAHADHAAGEVVFEVGVDALDGTALLIAGMLGGSQADALLSPGLAADLLFAGGGSRMGSL